MTAATRIRQTPLTQAATARGWLRHAAASLAEAGIDNARQEAIWLLEHATGRSRLAWTVEDFGLTATQHTRAQNDLARRVAREPLQYVLGTQEFCGLSMSVDRSVLIPRPETELLAAYAVSLYRADATPCLVDVGTGSGCIAIAVAARLPCAVLYATDRSDEALRVARENAVRHGVQSRIVWMLGDLLHPLPATLAGAVDLILSNPPYIPNDEIGTLEPEIRLYEPRMALAGGPDGLAIYRRLLTEAWSWLRESGRLAVEVGAGQAEHVRSLVRATQRFRVVQVARDDAGIDRMIVCQKVGRA